MSKKGMEPLGLGSSTVNLMKVSMVLMCWKNPPCVIVVEPQCVINIPLPYTWGFSAVLMVLCSKASM